MKILKKCAKCMADEIKWENFGFEHSDPEDFVKSKWQRSAKSLPYLIFRWILALFFVVLFIVCLALRFCDGKLFIYLTNWGITLCVLTNVLAAMLVTQWYFNIGKLPTKIVDKSFESTTPRLLKFYWLTHGVTLHLAVVITTLYWAFIHGKQNKPVKFPKLSFVTHTLNTVFMAADLIVVGFPIRILHTIYAMMLPIFYCLCTVAYYHLGGLDEYGNHFIYRILDWKKPGMSMTTFGGVFILYVIFAIVTFIVYKVKLSIHKALQRFLKTHPCEVV